MSPWIQTFTGRRFTLTDPRPEDIFIEDVAHSLALQCRFTGHVVGGLYSVAEHSVRVSWLCEEHGTREDSLWGLLHDASEAYIGDFASPLKRGTDAGLAIKALEGEIMRAVCARFCLKMAEPPLVKLADRILLATEKRDLMRGGVEGWDGMPEPLPDTIKPWPWQKAEQMYLARFWELA